MHPPVSILFHVTKGKLKSPLIIIVCFDFSTLLRIFSNSSNIISVLFFCLWWSVYCNIDCLYLWDVYCYHLTFFLWPIFYISFVSKFLYTYMAPPPFIPSFLSDLNIL